MDLDTKSKDEEISSLNLKLAKEKQRSHKLQKELELTKHVKNKEVEKYKRECMNLKENVSRLEADCKTLREREVKDKETIKILLEMVEKNETEFTEKLIECMKHSEEEAGAIKLSNENSNAIDQKGKRVETNILEKKAEEVFENDDIDIVEEMPKRSDDLVVLSDSDSDNMPMPSKKRVINDTWNEEEDLSLNRSSSCLTPCQLGKNEETGNKIRQKKKPKLSTERCSTKDSQKELQTSRKRSNGNDSREYAGRYANKVQQLRAIIRAEKIQSKLRSGKPSFIKSMTTSNVSGSFWLHLDTEFCKKNFHAGIFEMILEDEKGLQYTVKYLGIDNQRAALSGGWRGFAKAHNLEIHDALIFELCEAAKFKVYIIKAMEENPNDDATKSTDTRRIVNHDVDLCNFEASPRNMRVKLRAKQEET